MSLAVCVLLLCDLLCTAGSVTVSTLYSACNLSKNQVLQLFFRQQRKSKPEIFAIIVLLQKHTYLVGVSFLFFQDVVRVVVLNIEI